MMQERTEFYRRYYGVLVGYQVDSVALAQDEGGALWPTLTMTKQGSPDLEVEVSRDEEGNGPGFLLGLPRPL